MSVAALEWESYVFANPHSSVMYKTRMTGVNVSGMSQFTVDCNIPKEGFILVTSIVFFFPTINSFQSSQ